jgi:hypothetical protein
VSVVQFRPGPPIESNTYANFHRLAFLFSLIV